MTLSIPDGLIRALRENRLPAKVEVWHAELEQWVSLAAHPAARQALESIGPYLPEQDAIEMLEPEMSATSPPPVEDDLAVEPEPAPEVEPEVSAPAPDPLDLLLAAAHEFLPPAMPEPVETAAREPAPETLPPVPLVAETAQAEPPPARSSKLDITPPPRVRERRSLAMESPAERRRSAGPAPPAPEPVPAPSSGFKLPFALPSRRILLVGVAAVIALVYFTRSRKEEVKTPAGQKTVAGAPSHPPTVAVPAPETADAESLPPLPVDSGDTALTPGALELQGVPGGTPESDLETRLRLADALMWDPAQDFGSPGSVLRARRKVDAVRNSIQAYRVDMRRLDESSAASRQGNRLEPFDEASRIDNVVSAMGAAIQFLEDVSGRFSVRGGTLEFDRPEDARRYNRLRDQADSLLQSPVEMDPRPIFRPPRRFVTRLLITLPGGMARGASGP
ncbi:MAG TPA: hypothetical protein VGP80_02410 [Gemmatimonadales bacterium]|nr:hypothetical protein [Gemmatimonadales bacterium]